MAKRIEELANEGYLPPDQSVLRQVLENRLRDLQAQWAMQSVAYRTHKALASRVTDRRLRAKEFNPGVHEQIAPQTKQLLAQSSQNMEQLEIEIEIIQDDLRALDKNAPIVADEVSA